MLNMNKISKCWILHHFDNHRGGGGVDFHIYHVFKAVITTFCESSHIKLLWFMSDNFLVVKTKISSKHEQNWWHLGQFRPSLIKTVALLWRDVRRCSVNSRTHQGHWCFICRTKRLLRQFIQMVIVKYSQVFIVKIHITLINHTLFKNLKKNWIWKNTSNLWSIP